MNEDESHLNALAIGHYVVGGLSALFACFPLIHASVGIAFILGAEGMVDDQGQAPPDWFGWFFFLMGLAAFLIGQAFAVIIILSGRYLKQRRRYMFSFVGCFSFAAVARLAGTLALPCSRLCFSLHRRCLV